jgi:uncharacterized protein
VTGWTTVTRLDARAPYVLDTRELGRRPGTQRLVERTVPAPEQLGIELVAVPAGSDLQLTLRLEAVMEGVLLTGTARAPVVGECARCLERIEDDFVVDLQELYVYPNSEASNDEVARMEGDLLDLEPVLRDAVVLALPFSPLCTPDCAGLCVECGVRLADAPQHTHAAPIDPRWAALKGRTGGG